MATAHSILRAFREGDAAAFAEVIRAHAPLVRSVVARWWASPFEQEEAMQEIWLQLYRNREALDAGRLDEFPGWLSSLARNRCADLKRAGRAVPLALEDAATLDRHDEGRIAPQQVGTAAEAELRAAVAAFAARLEPQWRRFFELHFVDGLDYGEVAGQLGISRLRCKYMKKVLAARARKNRPLLETLGRYRGESGGGDARHVGD